jgi:hypothetical protein
LIKYTFGLWWIEQSSTVEKLLLIEEYLRLSFASCQNETLYESGWKHSNYIIRQTIHFGNLQREKSYEFFEIDFVCRYLFCQFCQVRNDQRAIAMNIRLIIKSEKSRNYKNITNKEILSGAKSVLDWDYIQSTDIDA